MKSPFSKSPLLTVLAGIMACVAATAVAAPARAGKPNVVLILTDDLGWQDVKCYDIDEPSPMETPNIDALAKKGVMFWQAYSPAPVCAPSRVAILSGLHPARSGVTSVSGGTPPHFWKPQAGRTSPWTGDHFPDSTASLAAALKTEGYVTGHSGKWHFSPQPQDIGFDSTVQHRGVQGGMPNRLTGFATRDPKDPFRLDENGFPYDVPQHVAMDFIAANKDQPFFLYYATWLVHGPISMKSEQLLQKYVKKLGVELKPEHKDTWPMEGQTNPFYCAMVEQLDYYLGQVFNYLETTDDPRWPGHKLVENTYIIFTSDNGGMENRPEDRYTENAPLDRGKISTKEGGTRVPLIITGPGIPAGVQTDVMANGLDFYPTILSWIGAKMPKNTVFDGCDLVPLLTGDPTDPALVRDAQGNARDTMVWHFPQMEGTTSIRVGDFKLRRSTGPGPQALELYRLYRTENGKQIRGDIEEQHNLAQEMPEKAKELEAQRTELIAAMGGRYGHWNPDWPGQMAGKETAPRILSHKQSGRQVVVSYQDRGAKVVNADLFYTLTGGGAHEKWRQVTMAIEGNNRAVATLPDGATHYFVNLIDENSFLVVYPKIDAPKLKDEEKPLSAAAVFAGYPEPEAGEPMDFKTRFEELSRKTEGIAIQLSEDFEGDSPAMLGDGQAGISITDATAASGSRSLVLTEEEGLERPWMPLAGHDITIPDAIASGSFRIAFDTMFDAENPGHLTIIARDGKSVAHYAALGDIQIKSGAAWANGKPIGAVKPGTWYHVEIAGQRDSKLFDMTVTSADGGIIRCQSPYADARFVHPTWVGLSGFGPTGSTIFIDNVVIRSE
ncbi:MAG: sulfatase [Verrucomicrobia bacterium]|jgi:arylsulfatase A-like enzyme|nr:sulfatase [Verrucomicrobiota bacterium]